MTVIGPRALVNDAQAKSIESLCVTFRTHMSNAEVAHLSCMKLAEVRWGLPLTSLLLSLRLLA